jgi:hypothetical protein
MLFLFVYLILFYFFFFFLPINVYSLAVQSLFYGNIFRAPHRLESLSTMFLAFLLENLFQIFSSRQKKGRGVMSSLIYLSRTFK